MKKKIASLFLVLAMCSTLCCPAFAANSPSSENERGIIVDSDGNKMEFSLEKENETEYILNYYWNGVLDTRYHFSTDNDLITATKVSTSLFRSENRYTFRGSQYVQMKEMPSVQSNAVAASTTNFGRINYRDSVAAGNNVYALLSYRSNVTSSVARVTARGGDAIADVTAAFTQILMSSYVAKMSAAIAAFFGWPALAAATVGFVIAAIGAEGVRGTVAFAFSEPVDCITTDYSIYGDIYGLKFDVPTYQYINLDAGAKTEFFHENYPVETEEKGILPYSKTTWGKSYLADDVWTATTFARYDCPGVKSYTQL